MQFIDTHLHLQDYKTGFATDIVKEALIGGVDRLVCAATGMFDWDKVARFAKQYPGTVVRASPVVPARGQTGLAAVSARISGPLSGSADWRMRAGRH